MFQLTADEYAPLMLQNATSKPGRGGRRKLPLAFTAHGAIMAATVLNSPRAVEMSGGAGAIVDLLGRSVDWRRDRRPGLPGHTW